MAFFWQGICVFHVPTRRFTGLITHSAPELRDLSIERLGMVRSAGDAGFRG
jgi:hypothetical protein